MKHVFVQVSLFCLLLTLSPSYASLPNYDAAIGVNATAGLIPSAKLTNAVVLNGTNFFAFNFGTNLGDATIEFILAGDPAASGPQSILAQGQEGDTLLYEQTRDTGQLGLNSHLFSPIVPSPTIPVHLAFVWTSATGKVEVYWNGSIAGTVSSNRHIPGGQGSLGSGMIGTIYRVTVYPQAISQAVIEQHADAFNDIKHPPIVISFQATPSTLFTPATATLTWKVTNQSAVFIDERDVSKLQSLTVSPRQTTTFSLLATNSEGSVTGQVTVAVNPVPTIETFAANKSFASSAETVSLNWEASNTDSLTISDDVGNITNVTAHSTNGLGSLNVQAVRTTTYTLTARNAFGTAMAEVTVSTPQPASHLVISEFMADNNSTLADEDGAFSDWIELFNPTAIPVELLGYFLTNNKNTLPQWAFPELSLGPGKYLLVFASGKNRQDPSLPLHTNFKLGKAGEYLALVGPGSVVLQEFAPGFPPQESDVSYGIIGADPNLVRYMGKPTPGAENDSTLPLPKPVSFSAQSGTFTNSLLIALTTTTPTAQIWYTLDGSNPGATNGLLYTKPILIEHTIRIRAVASKEGQTSRLSSASYIKLAPEIASYTSNLPMLVIENFGAGVIPGKGWSTTGSRIKQVPRQSAVWATFDRIAGKSALASQPQMFSEIGIRGRGSSSWDFFPQKGYGVETLDADEKPANVSPLGMPSDSQWTLYFPYPGASADRSLLFDTFTYELSGLLGRYSVRFRFVETFMNEAGGDLSFADRRGIYVIVEKVTRGKDRLDFTPLSEDGTTGGWLLGINRMDPEPETGWPAPNGARQPWFFHTAGPNRIQETPPNAERKGDDIPDFFYINFDNPNGYEINLIQRAAIEGWFKEFEDVLWDDSVWRDPVNGYRKYLDDRDFADYFILGTLTENIDAQQLSMFPWKGDDGRLRMGPHWDYNFAFNYFQIGPFDTNPVLWHPYLWYRRLFTDPDFMQLFIDRWWDLRRSVMSNENMAAIIDRQAAEISLPKALLNGFATTNSWATALSQMKTYLSGRAAQIESTFRPPPTILPGPAGAFLEIVSHRTNAIVYYTTDGSDPRATGGGVAQSAQPYEGPITLGQESIVQARIRAEMKWSGLSSLVFPTQDLSKLVVTEIMFSPPDLGGVPGDHFEFLELKNIGAKTLFLGGLSFSSGITFTFPNSARIEPSQCVVLARNTAAFTSRYPGVTLGGIFAGRLGNGSPLRLGTPGGATVFEISYSNKSPWPANADRTGKSLQKSVLSAGDNPANWVANSPTPGADLSTSQRPTLTFSIQAGLRLDGVLGNVYRIEYSGSLKAPVSWTTLTNLTLAKPAQLISTGQIANNPSPRYYRALLVQ